MTYINDIAEGDRDHLERLRREILDIVTARSAQETNALNRLVTYLGIVCSGATIAILSYLGQQAKTGFPVLAVAAFFCFAASLLSFALFLYLQFQLHSARWNLSADLAQKFFTRQAELEDVLAGNNMLTSKWTYRRLFWIPFSLLVIGFCLTSAAMIGLGPTTNIAAAATAAASPASPDKAPPSPHVKPVKER